MSTRTASVSNKKEKWDFSLLYTSDADAQIELDILQVEEACRAFRKKWHGKITKSTPIKTLLTSVREYGDLYARIALPKPYLYCALRLAVESHNADMQAMYNTINQRCNKAMNDILFYEIALGKLGKKTLMILRRAPTANAFAHFFERIKRFAPHTLSEEQEKVLSLKSLASRELWVQGVEKAVAKIEVTHEGKRYPIAKASGMVAHFPTKPRRALHKAIMTELMKVSDFAESEINALYLDKKISDELRAYTTPYAETIARYDNDEKAIESLVETITGAFSISHEFYKLKRALLGLEHLTYADRNASVGTLRHTFSFAHSARLLRDVLYGIKREYGEIFDHMLAHGQIDVLPRKGKRGGAFHAGGISTPGFVMLNHTNDFRSAETLAHEMGHAIHTERSRAQHPLVRYYSIAAAETASTFFEGLFIERLLGELSKDEQVIALHDIIQSDVSSIFRQIACFNFERALHETIRTKGGADTATIVALLNRYMQSYLGPSVELTELDGFFFVQWSHLRNFFYVYTYAYGQLTSKAMLAQYRNDSTFVHRLDQFLVAGGSDAPDKIFASIGLAPTPELFKSGLQEIRKNVTTLKKLMN